MSKRQILNQMAKITNYKIQIMKNQRKHRKEVNEDENIWLKQFRNRSDITNINPGRRDHVYTGKFNSG